MRTPLAIVAAVCGGLIGPLTAPAAVDYTIPGAAYTENFNSLASSGDANPWTNNETLPGIYVFNSGATNGATGILRNEKDNPSSGWISPADFRSDNANTSSRLMAFGNSADPDRALGAITGSHTDADRAPGDMFYALVLRNQTGQTLTSFTLSYTGEQWRVANTSGTTGTPNQTITVDYLLKADFSPGDIPTSGDSGDYTAIPDLTFNTPQDHADTSTAIDGNAAANRVVLTATIGSGFAWLPDQYLILRFFDDDSSGNDHGMGIDDLSFAAVVPEPAAVALLPLAVSLLAARRRRP